MFDLKNEHFIRAAAAAVLPVELTSGGQQETCSATVEVTFRTHVPSSVQQLYGKVVHLWGSELTD